MKVETDPKKKIMFDRALDIIRLIKKEGRTKAEVIGYEFGFSDRVAHVNCKKLVEAGILTSKKSSGGGYELKSNSIKVGQLFAAMDMPMLKTGNAQVDAAFQRYLQMEVFSV